MKDLYVVKVNMVNVSGDDYIGFSFADAYACFKKKCNVKNTLVVSVELCVVKYPYDKLDFVQLWDLVKDGLFENLEVLCYTNVKELRKIEL